MTLIGLIVVDGQRTFADALASRLAAEEGLQVIATATSAAAARALLVGRHADVVLLDSELTGGQQLAAGLTHPGGPVSRPLRVIMLGPVPEAGRVVAVLRAGIAGWVTKDDSIEHLVDAIRAAVRGEIWLPATAVSPVLQLLLLRDHGDCVEAAGHPLAGLTPREREVLSYLTQGAGRREVAERMHLSANTVRSHLQNLMGKLQVHSTLEAVAMARRAQLTDDLAVPPSPPQTSLTGWRPGPVKRGPW